MTEDVNSSAAPDDPASIRSATKLVIVGDIIVLLVFLTYTASILISPYDGQVVVENPGLVANYGQLVNGSVGQVFFMAFLLVNFRDTIKSLKGLKSPMGVILAIAVLSAVWSIDPLLTLHRAADLGLLLVMPAFFLRRLSPRLMLRVVWYFGFFILLISSLLALSDTPYALMAGSQSGLWRGLFAHKNHFGVFLFTFLLFTLFASPAFGISRRVRIVSYAFLAVALAMAGSAAALIIAVASLIASTIFLMLYRLRLSQGVTLLLFSLAASVLVLVADITLPVLLELVGREPTLTGRTGLWKAAMEFVYRAPWGYGYGTAGGEQVLFAMRRETGWLAAPSTHNGLITMLLDFGYLPTAIWVGWLLSKLLHIDEVPETLTGLRVALAGIAFAYLLNAFVDSVAGAYLSFPTFLLVLLTQVLTPQSQNGFQQNE